MAADEESPPALDPEEVGAAATGMGIVENAKMVSQPAWTPPKEQVECFLLRGSTTDL
jgi:hypothetical protein